MATIDCFRNGEGRGRGRGERFDEVRIRADESKRKVDGARESRAKGEKVKNQTHNDDHIYNRQTVVLVPACAFQFFMAFLLCSLNRVQFNFGRFYLQIPSFFHSHTHSCTFFLMAYVTSNSIVLFCHNLTPANFNVILIMIVEFQMLIHIHTHRE